MPTATPPATTAPAPSSRPTCWPGCRPPSPTAWDALAKNHGAAAEATLLDRLRKQLDDRGTLDVLRHGVELLGLRQPLALAQFKPALAMNPDIAGALRRQPPARGAAGALLAAQRERHRPGAVPQRHAGGHGRAEDRLHAERGRRGGPVPLRPRTPSPRARRAEPLLAFPGGALVHFAVSNSEVRMTTRLAGRGHRVPALQPGRRRRRRQPAQPAGGHRTAYLWERGLGARQLAGDPRPLPGGPARRQEAAQGASSSRATTSSTPRASCWRPCCTTGRAAST